MSTRKTNISKTAFKLFCDHGIRNTSTSRIAKEADVSEGLIFKHFKNKEGLLKSLIAEVEPSLKEKIGQIKYEEDPKIRIKFLLELPFSATAHELNDWKFIFQIMLYSEKYPDVLKLIERLLFEAFTELKYKQPQQEEALAMIIFRGIMNECINSDLINRPIQKSFLFKKYNLE